MIFNQDTYRLLQIYRPSTLPRLRQRVRSWQNPRPWHNDKAVASLRLRQLCRADIRAEFLYARARKRLCQTHNHARQAPQKCTVCQALRDLS